MIAREYREVHSIDGVNALAEHGWTVQQVFAVADERRFLMVRRIPATPAPEAGIVDGDELRRRDHFFKPGSDGDVCRRCGLHAVDPLHLRADAGTGGLRQLTNREREAVNALRWTYDMGPVLA